MNKKFKCIKGVATDHYVICMQNDIVEVVAVDENEIDTLGIFGWCANAEITFSAKEFAECFCVWVPTATVG